MHMVHVVNMDIQVKYLSSSAEKSRVSWSQDNQEEATIGAFLFHELMQRVSGSEDLDNEIDEILQDFEIKCKRSILHSVLFYWFWHRSKIVATPCNEVKFNLLWSYVTTTQTKDL